MAVLVFLLRTNRAHSARRFLRGLSVPVRAACCCRVADLRVAPKATTLADGIQEILRLLTLSSFEDPAEEEGSLQCEEEGGEKTLDEEQARKHYEHEEKLYKQYGPLVLRADPFLGKKSGAHGYICL